MGGEGSGRPLGVKGIIERQAQKPTLIGDSILLPDYSGVKKEALKTSDTPISGFLASLNADTTPDQVISIGSGSPDFTLYENGHEHIFNINYSGSSQGGLLSSSDWNNFNNKQDPITGHNLTESGSSVLSISNGTGAVLTPFGTSIQVLQSGSSQDGFLSQGDWNTFNSKINITGTKQYHIPIYDGGWIQTTKAYILQNQSIPNLAGSFDFGNGVRYSGEVDPDTDSVAGTGVEIVGNNAQDGSSSHSAANGGSVILRGGAGVNGGKRGVVWIQSEQTGDYCFIDPSVTNYLQISNQGNPDTGTLIGLGGAELGAKQQPQTTDSQYGNGTAVTSHAAQDGSSSHSLANGGAIIIQTGVGVNGGSYGNVIMQENGGGVGIGPVGDGFTEILHVVGSNVRFEVDDTLFNGQITCDSLIANDYLQAGNSDGGSSAIFFYSPTANKGSSLWTSLDNSGDTLTQLKVGSQADARVYTVPDAGADAEFSMNVSGESVAKIVATNDLTAQTSSVSNVVSATTPNDGNAHTYSVGGYLNVTALTLATVKLSVSYTDENNTSQTKDFFSQGLTTAVLSSIIDSSLPPMTIRTKANTSITILSTAVVTTSISYDVGGYIERIN